MMNLIMNEYVHFDKYLTITQDSHSTKDCNKVRMEA